MATHSSVPAWRLPWTQEPARLQSVGLQRFDVTEHAYRGMKELNRMVVILFISKKCLYTKIIILIDLCDLRITCLTKNERQLENILLPYPR